MADSTHIVRFEVDTNAAVAGMERFGERAVQIVRNVGTTASSINVRTVQTGPNAGQLTAGSSEQVAAATRQINSFFDSVSAGILAQPKSFRFRDPSGQFVGRDVVLQANEERRQEELRLLNESVESQRREAALDRSRLSIKDKVLQAEARKLQEAEALALDPEVRNLRDQSQALKGASEQADKSARQAGADAERRRAQEAKRGELLEQEAQGKVLDITLANEDRARVARLASINERYIQAVVERTTQQDLLKAAENRRLATDEAASRARVESAIADAQLKGQKAREILVSEEAIAAKVQSAVLEVQLTERLRRDEAATLRVNVEARRIKAERIVQEALLTQALREEVRQQARAAGLRGAQIRQLQTQVGVGGAGRGGGGGLGNITGGAGLGGLGAFFGGGFASVLRFAVPSALLFGLQRGIRNVIEEAEELIQITVRVEEQFRNLAQLGAFDDIAAGFGRINEETRRLAGEEALSVFLGNIREIARETGLSTAEVAQFGQRFTGLLASFGLGARGDLVGLATQATEITSQFAVISGLEPDEAFNDLAGAIRSFSDDAIQAVDTLDNLVDQLISVSDATGISSAELADFVGRVAPVAEAAGFELQQLAAVGATLLQGSAVGGAALAEQFSRIISTFRENIDDELARLAISVPEIGLNIDDIAAGNIRNVLFDLIDGFEKLSQAQQQQIIASIGSRREGNTLATLLQNNSAFYTALGAATEASGQRQERFNEIIQRLTGQLNQFRVALEQIGQRVLNSGVGDILSVLLETATDLTENLGFLIDALETVADLIGVVIPDGSGKAIAEISLLTAGVAALSVSLVNRGRAAAAAAAVPAGGPQTLPSGLILPASAIAATQRFTGPAQQQRIAATAGAFRGLGGAIRGVALAGLAFTAGSEIVSLIGNRLGQGAEEAAARVDSLTERLRAQGDTFVNLADQISEYVDRLESVPAAEEATSEEQQRGALAGQLLQAAEDERLSGPGDERKDLVTELSLLQKELNTDLQGLAESIGDNDQIIEAFEKRLSGLRSVSSTGDRVADQIEAINKFIAERQAAGEDIPDVILAIRNLLAGGEIDLVQAIGLANILEETGQANRETLDRIEQQIRDDLFIAAAAGEIDIDELETRLDAASGIEEVTKVAEDLLPEALRKSVEETESAVRENIDNIRQQFLAGIISEGEFRASVIAEINVLQELASAYERQNTPEAQVSAAETREAILNLNEELSDLARKRFDDSRKIIEALGADPDTTGLQSDLRDLAADPFVLASDSALEQVTLELVEAEREEILAEAERIFDLQARREFLESESESTSEAARRLLTRVQIRDAIPNFLSVFGLEEAGVGRVNDTFDNIIQAIESGASFEDAVLEVLRSRLSDLQELINSGASLGLGADDVAQIRAAIDSVLAQINLIESEGLPDLNLQFNFGKELSELTNVATQRIQAVLGTYEDVTSILGDAAETPANLGARISFLVNILNSGLITSGTDEAKQIAEELLTVTKLALAQQGAASGELAEIIQAQTGLTTEALQALAESNSVRELLADQNGALFLLLSTYGEIGIDTLNVLITSANNFLQGGASAIDALRQAIEEAIARLLGRAAALRLAIIGAFGNFNPSAGIAAAADLRNVEGALRALDTFLSSPLFEAVAGALEPITGGGFASPVSAPGGGGGADGVNERIQNALATFDLIDAVFALDPVKLAENALNRAQFQIDNAETEADRIRGLASQVNARRDFYTALQDVFLAENELAIALAQQAGNTELALDLAVQAAQAQLEFLEEQGAGAAAIARAQIDVINAEIAREEGLRREELDELDFLFQIGDLTKEGYIAALEEFAASLDQVADRDLWREIVLTIKRLKEETSELAFNLPQNFDIPLFQVRRLNELGFGGTPDVIGFQQGRGTTGAIAGALAGSQDNRNIDITINVQSGMDWEEAVQVIGEAIGVRTQNFQLDIKRY